MASSGGGASSVLSTESPPFNPRGGSTLSMGSQSPGPGSNYLNSNSFNRSRTASPVSNSSNSGNGGGNGGGAGSGESFSNAISKHTFQYEKYVVKKSLDAT